MTVPQIISLPKISDKRGNLSFIESNNHIPFMIKRTYWVYDVPGGEIRGAHAYKQCEEFIVALSGSFVVILNDCRKEYIFHLNRSYNGLYIPRMVCKSLENFSTNSLALVLASSGYDKDDYIRDFELFRQLSE